jgi:UDP-GlcNAc:undecaprenyl-phosphate GlcNAc-1-phosphate transferase
MFFLPFLLSFIIALGVSGLVLFLNRNLKFKKTRSFNSFRRLGGLAIIVGFIASLLLNSNLVISDSLWGIIIVSVFILVFGIIDDFLNLDWKTQMTFQILSAVLIFILGVRVEFITNPFGGFFFLNMGQYLLPSLVLVIAWIVLLINSMNWLDGIDGLSGGVSMIGTATIFFLSLKPEVNQPPVGIITMALFGSLLGFLVFNFHPSKILAGTSGSMFMGFILASLSIFAGAKIATALLVLAIPIIDSIWVIGERMRSGRSIFKSDKSHLHYKLIKLGWSQKKITALFYFITLCIAAIALNTRVIGKTITLISVSIIMLIFSFVINKKLREKLIGSRVHEAFE